ncbi:MAG: SDH family Clp fold serine proteinase [Candidatus Bathyarchaeia archaeon]|jgi:ClpP class serine protease
MTDVPIYQKVREEQFQIHSTRKQLYRKLEKLLGMPVISYFTSFRYPVMLEDSDAEMLEALLQACDVSKGFGLIINSPGGIGLAAERIINVCKSYSGTGEFTALVPSKAKSAATMVCLGASKIIMGKTSELGPVDPQITIQEDNNVSRFSIYNIVKSYEHLFEKAVNEKGNIQPYLQQLANYDEREIAEYKMALDLSDDITIRALKGGMLKKLTETEIKKNLDIFLIPDKAAKVHGRPIYAEDAQKCGLNIELKGIKEPVWRSLYELYIRLDNFVSINRNAKIIECCDKSFRAGYEGEK